MPLHHIKQDWAIVLYLTGGGTGLYRTDHDHLSENLARQIMLLKQL
jgi:hypothetical protein